MPVDAEEALRRATLIRSDPSLRGATRRNIATEEGEVKWEYLAPDGDPIEEEDRIQRWNSMGLPPAWEDVWICPNPRGHIQATGRDVKGRLAEAWAEYAEMRAMGNMTPGESTTLWILKAVVRG